MAQAMEDLIFGLIAGLGSDGVERIAYNFEAAQTMNQLAIIPFTLSGLTSFDLSPYVDNNTPWVAIIVDDGEEDLTIDHRIQFGLDPLGDGYYLPIAPGKFGVISGNSAPVRVVPLYLNPNTANPSGRIILFGTKS